MSIVQRAEEISKEFQDNFKSQQLSKRQATIPLVAQADFSWLLKLVDGVLGVDGGLGSTTGTSIVDQLDVIQRAIGRYEIV